MSTHVAVATVARKARLGIIQVSTIKPSGKQVHVRVESTASTPLDLHQNDGALLVRHPQVLSDGTAGTVVDLGPNAKRLKVGDKVFGFTWRTQSEKAHQEFCTADKWLFAKLLEGSTLAEAVTLPNNFVTVFHALTTDLDIETPRPKPVGYVPKDADKAILVWGGSSSVGQFAIQILKYYGYMHILATASTRHHEKLRALGAKDLFDYNDANVVEAIPRSCNDGKIPLIFDCISSKEGSMAPISKIAKAGAKVAILLPVIIRDSSKTGDP